MSVGLTRQFRFAGILGLVIIFHGHFQAQPDAFKKIDKHALKIRWEDQGLSNLTHSLILPAENDIEKIRAIFTWVTKNIEYDEAAYQGDIKRINHSNYDVLSRGKAVCFGYANLVKSMAEIADIPCEVISGYSKELVYSSPSVEEIDHAWNAVLIDNRWRLLDATWASGLHSSEPKDKDENLAYFLTDPQKFIADHLPSDPAWQLLPYPVNIEQFKNAYLPTDHMKNAPPYAFKDSIAALRALHGIKRSVKEHQRMFRFHPTPKNKVLLGASYIDLAIEKKEKADAFYENNQWEESIPIYLEAISHFEQAVPLTKLRDWQLEGYAYSLMNLGQALYNKEWDQSQDFEAVILYLKKAKQLLLRHPDPHGGTDYAIQFIDQYVKRLE